MGFILSTGLQDYFFVKKLNNLTKLIIFAVNDASISFF